MMRIRSVSPCSFSLFLTLLLYLSLKVTIYIMKLISNLWCARRERVSYLVITPGSVQFGSCSPAQAKNNSYKRGVQKSPKTRRRRRSSCSSRRKQSRGDKLQKKRRGRAVAHRGTAIIPWKVREITEGINLLLYDIFSSWKQGLKRVFAGVKYPLSVLSLNSDNEALK